MADTKNAAVVEAELVDDDILGSIVPFSGDPLPAKPVEVIGAGRTMQRVQSGYTTAVAVQKPRSLSVVAKNVLAEAQMAGESFYYGWNQSGKHIEGPTVNLAYAIARNYGNCAIETDVEETASHYMVKAVFIDLETGFSCPRTFRQRKSLDMGKMDKDRVEDIALQIAESKAVRNAIVKAMPSWLIEKAIDIAKDAVKKGVGANIVESRAKALKIWEGVGVTQERIEGVYGAIDTWTPEALAAMKGNWSAYKEGRISLTELFPESKPPEAAEKKSTKATANVKTKSTPKTEPPSTTQETSGTSDGADAEDDRFWTKPQAESAAQGESFGVTRAQIREKLGKNIGDAEPAEIDKAVSLIVDGGKE